MGDDARPKRAAPAKRANAGDMRRFLVTKRPRTDGPEPRFPKQSADNATSHPLQDGHAASPATAEPTPADKEAAGSPTAPTARPTRVVRLRRRGGQVVQGCDVYIGRRWTAGGWDLPQSEWANPYAVRQVGSAAKAVQLYEHEHLARRPDLVAKVGRLKGLVLGCWCKNGPGDPCHGDVLARLADAADPRAATLLSERSPKDATTAPPV